MPLTVLWGGLRQERPESWETNWSACAAGEGLGVYLTPRPRLWLCSALVAATNLTVQPLGVNRRPVVMDLGHVLMVGPRYLFLNILFLNKFQILLQIQVSPAPAITLFQEPPLLRAFVTPLSPRGDHMPQSRLYAALHYLHVFHRPNLLSSVRSRWRSLNIASSDHCVAPRDLIRSGYLW